MSTYDSVIENWVLIELLTVTISKVWICCQTQVLKTQADTKGDIVHSYSATVWTDDHI